MIRRIIKATSVLVGTVIGVGIFGLPYVASRSGLWLTWAYILGLGAIVILVHYFYIEIVSNSKSRERLVSYVGDYLGDRAKMVASVTVVLSRLGALLVYIIVSGSFLSALFGGNEFYWSLGFFVVGGLVIFWGLKTISLVEVLMSLFLLLVMVVIFVMGFPKIDFSNFSILASGSFFLPYGVVLFSLGGASAIPEMEEIIGEDKRALHLSNFWGMFIPIILMILFSGFVVGVSGSSTTGEALIGLKSFLGGVPMTLGLLFGIVALFTSFITLGLNVRGVFQYDFKLSRLLSCALVLFIPLVVFLLGFSNFIGTMGFLGAVFGALNAIFIVLIYKKLRPDVRVLPYVVIAVFALGAIYEIVNKIGLL